MVSRGEIKIDDVYKGYWEESLEWFQYQMGGGANDTIHLDVNHNLKAKLEFGLLIHGIWFLIAAYYSYFCLPFLCFFFSKLESIPLFPPGPWKTCLWNIPPPPKRFLT